MCAVVSNNHISLSQGGLDCQVMTVDIHECAKKGDFIHLQLILAGGGGGGVNATDKACRATALHYAVAEQHVEAVELLLNDFRAEPNMADKDGRTPLHNVVSKQADVATSLTLAKMLLIRGADPTAKTKENETILHQAAREGHFDLIKHLLKEYSGEIEVDATNDKDETPLFFAAGNSHSNIVLFLIDHKANPNIPNMKGRTPLHMALRWAKAEVKKRIEKAAMMTPAIEHVTLPSGLVIRKDLLPDSFDEIRSKLAQQRGINLDSRLERPPSPTYDSPNLSGHEHSFAAQVNLLGGRDPNVARLHHLNRPAIRTEGNDSSERLPRQNSIASSSVSRMSRDHQHHEDIETSESALHARTQSLEREKGEEMRKHEIERLADKERVRVDQRLRGLFYAGIQRRDEASQRRSRGGDQIIKEEPATQKEEELAQLNAEIRALKEAGFKDPSKEMRRLDRETRRTLRQERRAQREKEKEEEEVSQHEDGEVIGDLSAELLQSDVLDVIPSHDAFTLRRITGNSDPSNRQGMFGIINGLELRLKNMSNQHYELDKRCDQLGSIQEVLKQDMKTGRARHSAVTSATQVTNMPENTNFDDLPKRDQRIIAEIEQRIDVLEKRAKREIKRKKQDELIRGTTSIFTWWLFRLSALMAAVTYLWLQSSVSDFSPPPVW